MRYQPHNYQTTATKFITSHHQAAILLGMGLGKSVITLTALWELILDSFEVSRVLVVAPLRVARDTWPAELAKWDHLAGLDMAVAVGDKHTRLDALAKDAFITVINRKHPLARRHGRGGVAIRHGRHRRTVLVQEPSSQTLHRPTQSDAIRETDRWFDWHTSSERAHGLVGPVPAPGWRPAIGQIHLALPRPLLRA